MNEETIWRRDRNCGSETTSTADSTGGAGATLAGVMTAALRATTHNGQCEVGDACPATAACTCTACTKPKPAITSTKNTADHFWSGE